MTEDKSLVKKEQRLRLFSSRRNPFDCGEKLCNISNGVHAQATVNVDESKMIGSRIIAKMEGLQLSEHTFKKKRSSCINGRKSCCENRW